MDPSSEESDEGIITDNLGFGRLCVYSTVSRVSYDVERSAVRPSKRQQAPHGAEARVATGVLSYLNELLITRAVPLGDLGIVQRVLADGAQIEHRDSDGNTPLLLSIEKNGSLDLFTVLLQHGASVNAENYAGRSPLAAAVEKDRPVFVKRLLSLGANPDKVGEEALTKCSEEVRTLIEEKRAAVAASCKPCAVPEPGADKDSLGEVKSKYVALVLPTLLRIHSMPPAGLAPQAERALTVVTLAVLEHLPVSDAPLVKGEVAGAAFAVGEDMVASQTPCDVLLALRLVHAVVKADVSNAALVKRYHLLPIIQELAQERGTLYEALAVQPPMAIALAQQPAVALLTKVLPSTEASAQGVALLARKLFQLLEPHVAVSAGSVGSTAACSHALKQRLANGEAGALEELRDMLVRWECITSQELEEAGYIDALISFLEPGDVSCRQRRHALFWQILGEHAVGDVDPLRATALWSLVRKLQKVISRRECLDVPIQLGGAAVLAMGMDRGMRLLLEPHRVEMVSVSSVENATAAIVAAEDAAASAAAASGTQEEVQTRGGTSASDAGLGSGPSDRHPAAGEDVPCESSKQQLDAAVAPEDVPGPAFGVAAAEVGESPADGADTRKRGPEHDVAFAGGDAKVAAPLAEIQPAAEERQASIKREEEEMKRDSITVLVEPLVPVAQLSSHVLRLSDIGEPDYQEYCNAVVGMIIYDRPRVLLAEQAVPYCRAIVEGFRQVTSSGIGVHQLRYTEPAELDAKAPDDSDQRVEVVLAVRDYKLSHQRAPESAWSDRGGVVAQRAAATWAEAAEEEERCHMIVITYPHEAVPMDIFIDSVMGAVLQALRQADPGQVARPGFASWALAAGVAPFAFCWGCACRPQPRQTCASMSLMHCIAVFAWHVWNADTIWKAIRRRVRLPLAWIPRRAARISGSLHTDALAHEQLCS